MKRSLGPIRIDMLELRLLCPDDLPTTLEWRNRDDVRRWFKHSDLLNPEQHQGWFVRYQEKPDDYVFIAFRDGEAVGQLALYNIDMAAKRAEVGRFITAPAHRGQGHMRQALRMLMALAAVAFGLERLVLEVFAHNERAIHLYSRLGFRAAGNDGDLMLMEADL